METQTHDGSMVLLYMVCHGSHQYTPVMLASIYQHHGSYEKWVTVFLVEHDFWWASGIERSAKYVVPFLHRATVPVVSNPLCFGCFSGWSWVTLWSYINYINYMYIWSYIPTISTINTYVSPILVGKIPMFGQIPIPVSELPIFLYDFSILYKKKYYYGIC